MRNLDRLRCFVTVADHGRVKTASEILGFSPSVVSQRIRQLEQAWGVVLFDRTGRELRVTDVGASLLDQARAIVEAVDELDRSARAAAGQAARTVRIAYRHNAAAWVSRLARELAREAPRIMVVPMAREHHDVVDAVLSGAADLGIAGQADGLAALELRREPLGCLAVPRRHRLASAHRVTIHDLQGEPYLIDDREQHSWPRREITDFLAAHGVEPDYRPARLSSAQDLLTLVGAEVGLALVRSSRRPDRQPEVADGVVFRAVEGEVPRILDALLWVPGHAPGLVNQCVEILQHQAGPGRRRHPLRRPHSPVPLGATG
ncbi:MAG TPA: LysR family transcriptional regulator [Acidimicrobiales bacterium]